MNAKTLFPPAIWLGIGLTCLAGQAQAQSSTFQLQMMSPMSGESQGGPQGWASSSYSQQNGITNQNLQINCQGLRANQVYHLMASWGTNGELTHLSDFRPANSGAIQIDYLAGSPRYFTGTNSPGRAWGMMGGWTNQSWVMFPGANTNWCDWMDNDTGSPGTTVAARNRGNMGGMGSTGTWMGGGNGQYGGGMPGNGGGMPGNGGGTNGSGAWMNGWGGMGSMGSGWPAMTNWWSGMSNWWPTITGWCWDYTNMWNAEAGVGSAGTNWWGNIGSGPNHMMPLPPAVNPVPIINGLVVLDQDLQPVLLADLANPATFTYQVRRTFINHGIIPGATATLNSSATQRATHFALSAAGLAARTTYFIAINQADVTAVATDRFGRLQMGSLPSGVTNIRGIWNISILDRNANTVLSANLPPN